MFKKIFVIYKRFEKSFLKEDKTKDMVTYIKIKHQFRSMMCLTAVTLAASIFLLFISQSIPSFGPLLVPAVLVGFRTKSYRTMRMIFFAMMVASPARYLSTSLVLISPILIFLTCLQILIQTQSDHLMMLQLVIQAIGFYFYGMDQITAKIKIMSTEELIESARAAITCAFFGGTLTLLCMKVFYSQFSSLLRKVNTLTESLSKANSQLNEQNVKLQSNLEMKDVFIYTFSHELKNALNGLLGNLSLANDIAIVPQLAHHLSSAKVCGEILKNFIHNILDSGKLENGNLEVSPERKDVMGFFQNVWTICGKIIQNKRLKGSLEIEKNVPAFLDLDEQRMIQILLNLVSNAVKFTEKGYVRIHVSWQTISAFCSSHSEEKGNACQVKIEEERKSGGETHLSGDMREFLNSLEASPSKKERHHLVTEYQKKFIDGSQFYELNLMKSHWDSEEVLSSTLPEGSKGILKIQVLDSGCGMTTEQQEKLFQRFSQVSSIEGQRKVGTGLGLWICKELANRLDGDIKTRSIVGVGSVFELNIRAKVSVISKKPRKRPLKIFQEKELELSPKIFPDQRLSSNMSKVLVADDDSFNIELMKDYLTKFGINYFCAYDGEEAVSLFKKHHKEICYIITDNFMPKKTGTEAAFEITTFLKEKKLPSVPIMCISGDLKVSVGESGITSVIQKPINLERLKVELSSVYPQLAAHNRDRY